MFIFTTILFVLFYALLTFNAFAYIDPGSGSYLLQLLIAGILGTLTLLKIYWSRFKLYFSSLVGKQSETDSKK